MRTKQRSVTVGAAAMMIGSICPWATAFGFFSLNGLQCRFGWGTLIAGGLLVMLEAQPVWLTRQLGWAVQHARQLELATAGLAVVLCLFVIVGFGVSGPLVSTDWGLYFTLVAAVAVILGAVRRTP
jgi:hypothetical protein